MIRKVSRKVRAFLIPAMLAPMLALTGCEALSETIRIECGTGGECMIVIIIRDKNGNVFDPSGYDAGKSAVDLSQSGNTPTVNSGSATLVAYRNGSAVSSKTTSFYRNGLDELRFYSPSSINSWMSQVGPDTDYVRISMNNVTFSTQTGTNSVTSEAEYDGQLQDGDSDAWYIEPDGDGPPTHEQ